MTPPRSVIAAPIIVLLLAGCAGPGPSRASTSPGSAKGAPTQTSSAPTEAGDCTAADTDLPATTYTVLADDASTPVTITYTVFKRDGSTPTRTETVYGPVVSTLGYACVADSSGDLWTFTATTTRTGALSCLLGFGGRIVARDSAFNEAGPVPETVDCTGNPGR